MTSSTLAKTINLNKGGQVGELEVCDHTEHPVHPNAKQKVYTLQSKA